MIELYQIDNKITDILSNGTDENGELSDDVFSEIEKLSELRDALPEQVALCYKNELAEANAYKSEEQELAKRRKVLESRCKKYKDWLARNVEKSLKTSRVTVRITDTTRCVIEDDIALPEEYWRIKREADVAGAKAALMRGHVVPGAILVHGKSASIK